MEATAFGEKETWASSPQHDHPFAPFGFAQKWGIWYTSPAYGSLQTCKFNRQVDDKQLDFLGTICGLICAKRIKTTTSMY
jgi:hypothetical protein